MTDSKKSPLKLFQDMLATLLSVRKEELDAELEQGQVEKDAVNEEYKPTEEELDQ